MQRSYFLSLSGTDRPGLMDVIATTLSRHHANWLDSRLAHLGNQFAGVLRFSLDDARLGDLRLALEAAAPDDLTVTVTEEREATPPTPGEAARISVLGLDRLGIVSRLVSALAARGINVEDFRSGTESAPMSGEQLFRAEIQVTLPDDVDQESVRSDLEILGGELDLDIDLSVHDTLAAR